ncbi:MAG: hypothetical protein WC552_06710 [Candidatus Omnitrophota bacterium]
MSKEGICRYVRSPRGNFWFLLFLLFLAVFRFSLTTSGHRYWPDEGHYLQAFDVLESVLQGKFLSAGVHFFEARGRPGFVLFSMVPACIQHIASQLGIIDPNNPHLFDIPSIFNVFYALAITIIFYQILLLVIKNSWYSLIGTMIYSLLCNTNVYVRHLLPYDLSLFMFMAAFFLLLRAGRCGAQMKARDVIIGGALSALAFLTYSGYYLFVLVNGILVFLLARQKLREVFLYLFSAAAVIVLWELIARISGQSFIHNSLILSTDITQGTYSEGYVFLFRYLIAVEKSIGMALILFFSICSLLIFTRVAIPLKPVFLILILGYLCHATLGVFFHKIVFYGRIIHMYVPFLVLGTMAVVSRIPWERWRRLVICVLIGLSLLSFTQYAFSYLSLHYPEDFKQQFLSSFPPGSVCKVDELRGAQRFDLNKYSAVAVNVNFLYPIPIWFLPIDPPSSMELVKSVQHPVNFPSHLFEGYTVLERERVQARKYRMRLYLNPSIDSVLSREVRLRH